VVLTGTLSRAEIREAWELLTRRGSAEAAVPPAVPPPAVPLP